MKKWKTTFCILGILVHVESNPFEVVTSAIMTSNSEQNVDTLQYSNQKVSLYKAQCFKINKKVSPI